jgi:hypothetical protein
MEAFFIVRVVVTTDLATSLAVEKTVTPSPKPEAAALLTIL